MTKIYTLSSAFTFNATGEKVDAVASPATQSELVGSRNHFQFNFLTLAKKYTIYKLQAGDDRAIQGLVAFRPSTGALECTNMETCDTNKHGKPVCHGVGKAMVALCCKASLDEGLDGCIYFDAKNRLIPYYERFGARHLFGLRMIIDSVNAKRLIDLYF
ncbi:MAG: hypothetical protein J7619_12345 [Dyadobacter sp.]|uniref:GNAT family N-acetyltransferase n=1 Tax=Dyadobacter sp. TaxID=1914288 RepID=UPI001B08866F|nr:GNAT family N-acetyltransferase [Dyadobacter sp.]MBO9613483.1 hypothetical protein [Dyadobacter sp.]